MSSNLAGRRVAARSYVESYVALDRIRRIADRQHASFERWLSRIELAARRGQPELAALARRQALRAAELEADLRRIQAEMQQDVERLRDLALDP